MTDEFTAQNMAVLARLEGILFWLRWCAAAITTHAILAGCRWVTEKRG